MLAVSILKLLDLYYLSSKKMWLNLLFVLQE